MNVLRTSGNQQKVKWYSDRWSNTDFARMLVSRAVDVGYGMPAAESARSRKGQSAY